MKKIFYVLILTLSSITLTAQTIQWGPTTKLKVSMSNEFYPKFNMYLGNISGYDYYTSIHRAKTMLYTDKVDFVFIIAKQNEIITSTESTEIHYNYINIQIIDNQIAVFYFDDKNDSEWEIKVDFYNPRDFALKKTLTLFKFKPIGLVSRIINFSVSENKSLFGIMTLVIDPETNAKSFLVKTFDFQFNERSESYFDFQREGTLYFKNFTTNNDGSNYLLISEYKIEDNLSKINKLHLIQCSEGYSNFIEIPMDDMEEPCDYLIVKSNSNKDKLIITEKKSLKTYDLFFKTEDYYELNTHYFKEGNWIIDHTLKLENGNFFISLTNTGSKRFTIQNGVITIKYFKNLQLMCLDSDLNQLVYETRVNRYYSLYDQYAVSKLNIDVKPLYLLDKNSVTLLFNNDALKYVDEIDDEKKIVRKQVTLHSNFQKSIIDESGNVFTKILTNSSLENGKLINGFCHANSDNSITIAKVRKKQITFGTLVQEKE